MFHCFSGFAEHIHTRKKLQVGECARELKEKETCPRSPNSLEHRPFKYGGRRNPPKVKINARWRFSSRGYNMALPETRNPPGTHEPRSCELSIMLAVLSQRAKLRPPGSLASINDITTGVQARRQQRQAMIRQW